MNGSIEKINESLSAEVYSDVPDSPVEESAPPTITQTEEETKKDVTATLPSLLISALSGTLISMILLSAKSVSDGLLPLFGNTAERYASAFEKVPLAFASIFALAAELSRPDTILFIISLLLPTIIFYRPILCILVFLKTISLTLGIGLVMISGAAVFSKVAVAVTYSVSAVSLLYSAYHCKKLGDALHPRDGTRQNIRGSVFLLKLLYALGASILARLIILSLSAFIY